MKNTHFYFQFFIHSFIETIIFTEICTIQLGFKTDKIQNAVNYYTLFFPFIGQNTEGG
jgi:hypothetical protein